MRVEFKEEEVFKPGPSTNIEDYKPVKDIFFTYRGQHDCVYDDMPALKPGKGVEFSQYACARKTGHKYFVRINSHAEIYNPFDQTHAATAEKVVNNIPQWKYTHVSYACFKNYILFLQTRNPLYLTWTRREMVA